MHNSDWLKINLRLVKNHFAFDLSDLRSNTNFMQRGHCDYHYFLEETQETILKTKAKEM